MFWLRRPSLGHSKLHFSFPSTAHMHTGSHLHFYYSHQCLLYTSYTSVTHCKNHIEAILLCEATSLHHLPLHGTPVQLVLCYLVLAWFACSNILPGKLYIINTLPVHFTFPWALYNKNNEIMNNMNCPPSLMPSGTWGDGKLMCELEWPHSLDWGLHSQKLPEGSYPLQTVPHTSLTTKHSCHVTIKGESK